MIRTSAAIEGITWAFPLGNTRSKKGKPKTDIEKKGDWWVVRKNEP